MAILTMMTMDIKPGRRSEAIEMVSKLGDHTDRVGGHRPRIFQATYAGEGTGTLTLIVEHDSMSHLGGRIDQELADMEYQSHLSGLAEQVDLPIENVRSAILSEIHP